MRGKVFIVTRVGLCLVLALGLGCARANCPEAKRFEGILFEPEEQIDMSTLIPRAENELRALGMGIGAIDQMLRRQLSRLGYQPTNYLNDQVILWLAYYLVKHHGAGRGRYTCKMFQRRRQISTTYQFTDLFQRASIPQIFELLPIVESQYQSDTVSPKGAAGLWQLMPESAQWVGLDPERRTDIRASTEAAVKLLTIKHHEFEPDQENPDYHQGFHRWALTVMAWNAGTGRVKGRLKSVSLRDNSAQAVDILLNTLPQETRCYFTHFVALAVVEDYLKQYPCP